MHRQLAVLLLTALAAVPAGADTIPAVSPAAVRAHVEFLADDLLEGRTAGSRGHEIAARYVATQMALMGLKPAGENGTWLQTVPVVEATRVIPAAKATIERGGERIELVAAEDFLPGFNYFGTQASVSAPVVFVGFGISAPELDYDDFTGVDLKGKIAVILSGAPERFPHSQRAHYSSGVVKRQELVARGAVGVIALSTPDEEKRVPWARTVQSSWVPRMRYVDASGQPVEAFPEIKASMELNLASAPKLFAGAPRTLEQVFADAKAGTPQAFDLPATVSITTQNTLVRGKTPNVIGLIEGSDKRLRSEYIVFTAHLDHIGRGAAVNGDTIYNGAQDNATGVAVMLEAARAIVNAKPRPKRSILVIAVTGEERGLLGSDYFAKNPTVPREALVANLNMDMPVALWPATSYLPFGAEHSTLGAVVERALKAEGLHAAPDERPEEVFFVRSDQYSFVRQGIPAIYLDQGNSSSDPAYDPKKLLEEFLKVHYHLPSDDTRLPIHYPSLAQLARVNARMGLEIANTRERPRWLPGDFFGEKFGTELTRGRAK